VRIVSIEAAYLQRVLDALELLSPLACSEEIAVIKESLKARPVAQPVAQLVQSCYCPNCEALSKELAALKAQPDPTCGLRKAPPAQPADIEIMLDAEEDERRAQPTPVPLNPMQPIVDVNGVTRFKKNGLVDALYEHGVKTGLGLNELHCMKFSDEDRMQFAQLIGYSLSGYGSLSYVSDASYDAAEEAAHGIAAAPEKGQP
jgi:hypothetical protein